MVLVEVVVSLDDPNVVVVAAAEVHLAAVRVVETSLVEFISRV